MVTIDCPIRPADCDSFGHVNNAVYVSHLEHALAAALSQMGYAGDWSGSGDHLWQLKNLAIEYRQATVFGDSLRATIWLDQPDPIQPLFGCQVQRLNDTDGNAASEILVRAQAAWSRLLRQTGQATSLPEDLLHNFPRSQSATPRPFKVPDPGKPVRRYLLEHTVTRTEVNAAGFAHPQALYQWIEDGIFDASAQGGWSWERCLAEGFVVFQIRHDSQFYAFPRLCDEIRISNRLITVRRLRGTWFNEIHRTSDGRLLARNYSTGVFLNLDGRPASPPEGMMDEIMFGKGAGSGDQGS